ncbi:MAG: hypothetical protein ABSE49_17260 [Polyangiaceae bacterium]
MSGIAESTAWVPFVLVCAIGLGRTLTASAPSPPAPIDDAQKRDAFRFVASDEYLERREASKTFPTDLWSRDDDFHQREASKARDWARTHHASVGDTLSAVDEGMREHWLTGSSNPLVVTVPPCRPRAIY